LEALLQIQGHIKRLQIERSLYLRLLEDELRPLDPSGDLLGEPARIVLIETLRSKAAAVEDRIVKAEVRLARREIARSEALPAPASD